MKVFETNNELIIKETPAIMWLLGIFFASIGGILLYGALGGFSNYYDIGIIEIYVARFMAICAILTGIWIIHKAPITTININKLMNKMHIVKKGVFSKKEENIYLDNVKKFLLIKGKDSEGDDIWTFGFETIHGNEVEISSLPFHNDYQKNLVFQANKYINRESVYSVSNM
jgi:hypothetical protein